MISRPASTATRYGDRKAKGSSLAELPLALWLIFGLMMMPMLSMATLTLRSALMNVTVQNAAQAAAKAKTFATGTSEKPSAMQIAEETIRNSVATFPGLRVTSINCAIVTTAIAPGSLPVRSGKLTTPADSSRFVYQIETVAQGQIEPLFKISPGLFGNVPGVTAPLVVSYVARQMAENPQGLDK